MLDRRSGHHGAPRACGGDRGAQQCQAGFITLEQDAKGLPDWGTDITNLDFIALAEACGALGVSVTDPKDLDAALQQVLAVGRPAVVNVSVDPNALIMPPKIELAPAMKLGMAKIRETFAA